MPNNEFTKAVAQLIASHDVKGLKTFLEANVAKAQEVVECFRELHKVTPSSKALNFLDQVLLLNPGKFPAYEQALRACAITRALPENIDMTKAPDAAVVNAVHYIIEDVLPPDRIGTTVTLRFMASTQQARLTSRRSDRNRFFQHLRAKLTAATIDDNVMSPALKA